MSAAGVFNSRFEYEALAEIELFKILHCMQAEGGFERVDLSGKYSRSSKLG